MNIATRRAAWGMEIGSYAIKAIRLEREGENVTVSDFAVIPHKKVLSTPDLDQDEMVRLGLGQFISQKSLEGEHLVMSLPGHVAFARFAKLPPVEPKKVPDIVKFEAVQQIPFPIDDVEWDYQTFSSEDSPEVEVGIFAITRERVMQRLGLYGELGIAPENLTLSPVAVYNAMAFDHDLDTKRRGPVTYLDIGTHATDVIIAEEGRCWIRTFPLGGTHFTEAIASAFKLSYSKAEKLKREAATSKYAKQIMQAMRPVFSDLLQDLQRSIGYYQTLHRDAKLETIVGLGSTFKIPGLRKFIGQQLQIEVVRVDEYKKITVTGRQAASFSESAVNLATAYGLALQGVGLARINANLVPVRNLREQLWHAKTKWFAAAAAIVIAGSVMSLYRPLTEAGMLEGRVPVEVENVLDQGEAAAEHYRTVQAQANPGAAAMNMRRLLDYRNVWPFIVHDVNEALASADPQPELLETEVDPIRQFDPKQRKLVLLRDLFGQYLPPDGTVTTRRIGVTMQIELSHEAPDEFVNDTVAAWLREHAEREGVPYRILGDVDLNLTLLKTFEVDEDGQIRDVAAGTERPKDRPGRQPPRRPPSGFQRPGATSPPPQDTGGGGMGGGQGMPGRRKPQKKRVTPGSGGDSGRFATGDDLPGGTQTPVTTERPSQRERQGDWRAPRTEEMKDLEKVAPIPEAPQFYPTGANLYRMTITFTVEIIDPNAPSTPDQTAGLDDSQREGRS